MTALSPSAMQKAEPKTELPKPTRPTPPAAATPAMVEPITKPTPAKPAQQAAVDVDEGGAALDRRDRAAGTVEGGDGLDSNEGGLSTGGTGASNQGTVNFCDPQYLGQMVSLIYNNWRQRYRRRGKADHPVRDPA